MTDFENIFRENSGFIYKYLLKLCRNKSLAEELTQETFFRAYMNISKVKNKDKIPLWLCQIAKNCYFSWYNQNKRFLPMEEARNMADTGDFEELFSENELTEEAFRRLHELEEPYKEVFMLRVLGQVSLKDISKIFGKSESWARVTFYRGKQKLIEKLR